MNKIIAENKYTFIGSAASIIVLVCFMAYVYFVNPVTKLEGIIDEHKIILAVLSLNEGRVLLREETIEFPELDQTETEYWKKAFPQLGETTAKCSSAIKKTKLNQDYLGPKFTLFNEQWQEEVMSHKDFWFTISGQGFHGFNSVTRPCFVSGSEMAIVYTTVFCGGLCGGGDYFLLVKENGRWKIINRFTAWVS